MVFPVFLFISGASITLSFQSRLARGDARASITLHVLKRSLLIFAIGLLLNALPFFRLGELRYYGVLQRIALCYALAGIVYLAGGIGASAAAAVAALGGYWWLLTHVRVPGFGMPGVDVPPLDPSGNLAAWLDRLLVPAAHLYHHTVYDPEGLLSTLGALGTTLIGVLAGDWLQGRRPAPRKASALLAGGVLLVGSGLLWAQTFPLNKRLWTSSYALLTAGIAMVLLAAEFWLIDGPMRLRWGLTPWLALGTNALAAYVLSEVLAIALAAVPAPGGNMQQLLYHLLPPRLGPPPLVSMLYSCLFVVVCSVPLFYLYRRRIFLKL
jgi:predicted acyltransferase